MILVLLISDTVFGRIRKAKDIIPYCVNVFGHIQDIKESLVASYLYTIIIWPLHFLPHTLFLFSQLTSSVLCPCHLPPYLPSYLLLTTLLTSILTLPPSLPPFLPPSLSPPYLLPYLLPYHPSHVSSGSSWPEIWQITHPVSQKDS